MSRYSDHAVRHPVIRSTAYCQPVFVMVLVLYPKAVGEGSGHQRPVRRRQSTGERRQRGNKRGRGEWRGGKDKEGRGCQEVCCCFDIVPGKQLLCSVASSLEEVCPRQVLKSVSQGIGS